jgi:hypothetical protein
MPKDKIYGEQVLKDLQAKIGNSSDESKNIVIEYHGGIERQAEAAIVWGIHMGLIYNDTAQVLVAYATAIDIGVRIGLHKAAAKAG